MKPGPALLRRPRPPVLRRLTRRALRLKGKKNGATGSPSFSIHPPRFYLRGSRSIVRQAAQRAPAFLTPSGLRHLRAAALRRSCVAAFHLEPLRCHLSGFLEKILRGAYEALMIWSSMSKASFCCFAGSWRI